MNCFDYRHRAAAQWFLSNISLDGNSCPLGQRLLSMTEDVDENKIGLHFTDRSEIPASNHRSDLCRPHKSSDLPTRKNVCFGEVFEDGAVNGNELHASIHPNSGLSISTATGQLHSKHELLTHSISESFRFAISTVGQRRPPVVVASVIPLSRDPLMLSGIPKAQNGTPGTISSGGVNCRQRSVSEMPTTRLNNLFRHNTGGNVITNSPINCPQPGSIIQEENLTVAKPLRYSKPVDSVERSYAHFLVPRGPMHYSLNLATPSTTNQRHNGLRSRSETVAGDELPELGKFPSMSPSTVTEGNDRQFRSRSHTLSLSSTTSAVSRPDQCSSFLRETALWGHHSAVNSTAYPSSLENMEPSQAVVYEDPLIKYDPLLLDDPMVPRVTNRRVFPFQGYMTSILGYRRADEHKKSINREFRQRFPNVQLTLTKMRSIKLNILAIALRMNLDLWIVAHAYVLFEKIILKLFVCKANRKLCAGASLLISAKLNDLKGPVMPAFIQEIENEFRISHRDLIHMEMAAFIGLEFCVLPSPIEALPHFTQIQKSLGVAVAAPRFHSVPTQTYSLEEDENLQSHSSPGGLE